MEDLIRWVLKAVPVFTRFHRWLTRETGLATKRNICKPRRRQPQKQQLLKPLKPQPPSEPINLAQIALSMHNIQNYEVHTLFL